MLNTIQRWSIYITVLILPWYVIRFNIGGVPTTLLEISVLFTIAIWGVRQCFEMLNIGISTYLQSHVNFLSRNRMVIIPIVLFVIAATISVFTSNSLTAALGIYKAYFIEPVLLGVAIWSGINQRREWWTMLALLLLASLQVSFLAVSQQVLGWPNFAPAEMLQGRSSAMFNSANAVGLFIGPITLFFGAIAIGVWRKSPKVSFGLLACIMINMAAIALSQSSGALIAILGSVITGASLWFAIKQGWINYRNWIKLIWAGLALYVAAVMIFMVQFNHPPTVANPYTRPGFSTFTVRQCTWQGTMGLLSQNVLLGSGLASFGQEYVAHATCDAEPLVYPHNLVLNFWVETGLLGVLSMIWLTIVWLGFSAKLLFAKDDGKWVGLGATLILVYWLIHGLVDVPYFKNDLAMLWWIGLSLTAIASIKIFSTSTSRA